MNRLSERPRKLTFKYSINYAIELIIAGIITYFMSIIFKQIVRNDQALIIKTKSNIIGRGKIKTSTV